MSGDLETCERHYQRALEIGERLGSERVRTAATFNLGMAAATRRDFDEALRYVRQAVRSQVEQGRRDTLPPAVMMLSLKHIAEGRIADGARLLAAAEQMNRRLGQHWEYSDRDLLAVASEAISRLEPQERAAAEAAAGAMDEEQMRRELFDNI
jgi:tetratricopeptide (TPR) repeat protein